MKVNIKNKTWIANGHLKMKSIMMAVMLTCLSVSAQPKPKSEDVQLLLDATAALFSRAKNASPVSSHVPTGPLKEYYKQYVQQYGVQNRLIQCDNGEKVMHTSAWSVTKGVRQQRSVSLTESISLTHPCKIGPYVLAPIEDKFIKNIHPVGFSRTSYVHNHVTHPSAQINTIQVPSSIHINGKDYHGHLIDTSLNPSHMICFPGSKHFDTVHVASYVLNDVASLYRTKMTNPGYDQSKSDPTYAHYNVDHVSDLDVLLDHATGRLKNRYANSAWAKKGYDASLKFSYKVPGICDFLDLDKIGFKPVYWDTKPWDRKDPLLGGVQKASPNDGKITTPLKDDEKSQASEKAIQSNKEKTKRKKWYK